MIHVEAILKVLPATREEMAQRTGLPLHTIRNAMNKWLRPTKYPDRPRLMYISSWVRPDPLSKPCAVYSEGNLPDVPRNTYQGHSLREYRDSYNARRREERTKARVVKSMVPDHEFERNVSRTDTFIKQATAHKPDPFAALFNYQGTK